MCWIVSMGWGMFVVTDRLPGWMFPFLPASLALTLFHSIVLQLCLFPLKDVSLNLTPLSSLSFTSSRLSLSQGKYCIGKRPHVSVCKLSFQAPHPLKQPTVLRQCRRAPERAEAERKEGSSQTNREGKKKERPFRPNISRLLYPNN